MKNYAVLEGMKRHQKTVLNDAFNKGYDQGYQDGKAALTTMPAGYIADIKKAEYERGYKEGKEAAEEDMCKYYNKHFNDVVHSSNDDAYQRGYKDAMQNPTSMGYQHGYEAGLQHGQELRIEEAECAEACGMKRAWQAVRKIMYMSLFDLNELFPGWDVENIIEKLSAKEVIEKVEVWKEKKQEQIEKNCDNCKHNNVASGIDGTCYECVKGVQDNYEEKPKQDVTEMNVGNIEVGDEVTYNLGNVMVVTRVYSESRSADLLRYDGTVEQQPLEILTPTGKHYEIQTLFDAIKPDKPEKGGE